MNDERMQAGIAALRAGRNREARRIFSELVRQQPRNAAAWWYLSAVTDEPSQKVQCLEEVLRLEPGHTAAKELLRELAPRVRSVTPPRGTEPPILDATERTGNQMVINDVPQVIEPSVPPKKGKRGWIGLLIVAAVLLLGVAWVASAIRTGFAYRSLELATPTPRPTLIPFLFDPPNCLPANEPEATVVFVNETGMELVLLRGPEGREEEIATIGVAGEESVVTAADIPVRFVVQSQDATYDHSGAIIQISAANICRVTLHK